MFALEFELLGEHPNSKMAEAEDDGRVLVSPRQLPAMPIYDYIVFDPIRLREADLAPGMFGHQYFVLT